MARKVRPSRRSRRGSSGGVQSIRTRSDQSVDQSGRVADKRGGGGKEQISDTQGWVGIG